MDRLEEALRLDPLQENLYRDLMRVHLAAGRRSHALAAFERCRRVLASELDSEPSGETLALREIVRAVAAQVTAPPAEPRPPRPAGDVPIPFVTRERELGILARL